MSPHPPLRHSIAWRSPPNAPYPPTIPTDETPHALRFKRRPDTTQPTSVVACPLWTGICRRVAKGAIAESVPQADCTRATTLAGAGPPRCAAKDTGRQIYLPHDLHAGPCVFKPRKTANGERVKIGRTPPPLTLLPPASANSDIIRWGRVLLSHTLDAARSY